MLNVNNKGRLDKNGRYFAMILFVVATFWGKTF